MTKAEAQDQRPDDPPADEGDGAAAPSDEAADDARLAELKDKWLRALAELENVRRAARLEGEQVRLYGSTPLLRAMLGVLDDLQRALASPPAGLEPEYLSGLRLIERNFIDALAAHGVQLVAAEPGGRFDPSVHRAIMEQDSDTVEPGAILATVQAGYRLHDRLLREAHVIVARAPKGAEG